MELKLLVLFQVIANSEGFKPQILRTRKNKLVEPKEREYRRLLALGSLLFLVGFWLTTAPVAKAAILKVDSDGKAVWNVLSEEATLEVPRHSFIEVKKIVDKESQDKSLVNLTRKDDKISLVVSSGNEVRELNVAGWEGDLVEIEERPEVQRLVVGVAGEKFSLEQKDITALTDKPIEIDSRNARVSIATSGGSSFLSILPLEAVETALRTKLLTRVSKKNIELSELKGELQYKISGEKVINLINLFEYSIPATLFISASTGEILAIDSPTVFKYLGFLFI